MAGDWTITRVVFAPQQAADMLNGFQDVMTRHNVHVRHLLEANNRYLERARSAEERNRKLQDEVRTLRASLKATL